MVVPVADDVGGAADAIKAGGVEDTGAAVTAPVTAVGAVVLAVESEDIIDVIRCCCCCC